jgi:hypothetical protein
VADYVAVGVTGVSVDNVAAVNAQVLAQAPGGAATPTLIQALVAPANLAIAKIEAYNNGDGVQPQAPTVADYVGAGISGVTTGNIDLTNQRILALAPGGADTSPEIQAVATGVQTAIAKIDLYHKGDGVSPAALALADYTNLGISGVTAANLGAVNSWVLNQAKGVDQRVNTTITNNDANPTVITLNDGGWVVLWHSSGAQDGAGYGVYQQRYNADGSLFGGETRVNTYTTSDQMNPVGAVLPDGGWVVSWMSSGEDGSGYGVYLQRYSADGAIVGSETRVNTTTANNQQYPSITVLSGGGWVVTWSSYAQDATNTDGVYQQRYDATGAAVGAETLVNTTTAGNQSAPAITYLSDGGWVVAYQSPDANLEGIFLQRYNAGGVKLGVETRVNSTTTDSQTSAAITALSGGGWVVTWSSNAQDGSLNGVYQQRYNADGTASGTETRVNTTTADQQTGARVTALSDGGWVVIWQSNLQDGAGYGIYQQRYASTGVASGVETRVNTYTTNGQDTPSITALPGGGWITTWESYGEEGNATWGVYQQRYDASGQPVRNDLTAISQIQGLVNNVTIAQAKIEAWNQGDGATAPVPTLADYLMAGVTGVTRFNVAAVNAHVVGTMIEGADSASEIQALVTRANTALAKIEAYNNGNGISPPPLTLNDYAMVGVTGVSPGNLAAVNAQVLAAPTYGADTGLELQALVASANTALARIEAYNNGDGTTPAALTLPDYAAAGITGVTAGNLAAVNAQILAAASGAATTIDLIQQLVTAGTQAISQIEAFNNGTGISPAPLTLGDYQAAGVTGVSQANLAAVNAQVLAQSTGGATTTPLIQALVTSANSALAKIEAYNNGNGTIPAALSLSDYAAAGITGVNTNNLAAVNFQVLSATTGGADSVGKIQTLAGAALTALAKIEAYNDGDGSVPSALTPADYQTVGITGVTQENLAAVNMQVLSAVFNGADTVPEIQGLVAAANAALAKIEAYNNGNGISPLALTVNDYANAGITGVNTGNLATINAQILASNTGGADTVPEIQSLVNNLNMALAKIEAFNNGDGITPSPLTLADYMAASVTGVNAGNLAAVNAQVLAAASYAATTPDLIQGLVTAGIAALNKIEAYNNGTGISPAALTLADYQSAGITGVTPSNLQAVNAQVLAAVPGAADTVPEIQGLVTSALTALAKFEAYNNGNGINPPPPSLQDYAIVGITGVTNGNLKAVNAQVLAGAMGDADSLAKVQALVSAANAALTKVETYNNGNGVTPASLALGDFAAVGVTGVSQNNLVAVNAQILKAAPGAADTVDEIQALVGKANAALQKIEAYNNGNGSVPEALCVMDYLDVGVSGVDAANLLAVNAQVLRSLTGGADTVAKIQSLVGNANLALAKIEAYNNGTGNTVLPDGTAVLTMQDYEDVGVTGVSADNLATVNMRILQSAMGEADTVSEVQNLVVRANAALAKIESYNTIANTSPLVLQDYLDAGITGVTAANLAAVNAQVLQSAASGADTLGEIALVITHANVALAKIEAYNNGTGSTVLPDGSTTLIVSDYVSAGISGVTGDNLTAVNAVVLAADPGEALSAPAIQTLVAKSDYAAVVAMDDLNAYLSQSTTVFDAQKINLLVGETYANDGNLLDIISRVAQEQSAQIDTYHIRQVVKADAYIDQLSVDGANGAMVIQHQPDGHSGDQAPSIDIKLKHISAGDEVSLLIDGARVYNHQVTASDVTDGTLHLDNIPVQPSDTNPIGQVSLVVQVTENGVTKSSDEWKYHYG